MTEEKIKDVNTAELSEDNEFIGEEAVPVAEEAPLDGRPKEEELSAEDLVSEKYIQNPETGESITLDVKKIISNPRTKGTNKITGEEFIIGCKKKDGTVVRRDIITDEGRYTVKSWEVFYSCFGSDGVISKYAKEHGKFDGLKIKITKNYNGNYAMKDVKEIMKLMDFDTIEKAEAYKKEVALALKEHRLYTVEKVE